MYAKALIPGMNDLNVPLVIATAEAGTVIVDQLHGRGWTPFGGDLFEDADAKLHVTPNRFAMTVLGQALLEDDVNPYAPPGWWPAASALGDMAVCVVARAGRIDLNNPDVGTQLHRLIDSREAAQALLTLQH